MTVSPTQLNNAVMKADANNFSNRETGTGTKPGASFDAASKTAPKCSCSNGSRGVEGFAPATGIPASNNAVRKAKKAPAGKHSIPAILKGAITLRLAP